MGVIEAFNQPISHWMSYCLVAMSFLEIKSGPGESVLHMMYNTRWDVFYDFSMDAISLGR